MYLKGIALVFILSSFSFTKAGVPRWIKNRFEDFGYDALKEVIKSSPWLCPLISELIGDDNGDVKLESIFFIKNTTYIGYNSDSSIRGNFYFQTLSKPLYGLGPEGATYNKKYDV